MGDEKDKKKQWAIGVPGGKNKPKGTVTMDDDQAVVVRSKKPLAAISWKGHHGTLYAMTDTSGNIVTGGGNNMRLRDMSEMNTAGKAAVAHIAQINQLETTWRQDIDMVRKALDQSAADIKKVEVQMPAVSAQHSKDDNFVRDVDAFLTATSQAESIIERIRTAKQGFDEATLGLKKEELWKEFHEKQKEVKADEAAVKAKEAEIARAKKFLGEVYDIAEKIVHQDWAGLAAQALDFAKDTVKGAVIDSLVDARYGAELAVLQNKLAKDQAAAENLNDEALKTAVDKARVGLSKAASELENVRNDFVRAAEHVGRVQTMASDRLKKSPKTAAVGAMLEQRGRQVHAINTARSACEFYLRISAAERRKMSVLSNNYGRVGSWLTEAAAEDPKYNRSQPYAKSLELASLGNSVELGNWDAYANSVESDCKQLLAWVTDATGNGPMVHFDRLVNLTKEALANPK